MDKVEGLTRKELKKRKKENERAKTEISRRLKLKYTAEERGLKNEADNLIIQRQTKKIPYYP